VDRRENLLLIVDDDAWTRYALARLLRLQGWQVQTASCVAEALVLLNLEPDCVILDLFLPDGDGVSVLRRIRERGQASRVVVCTVSTDASKLESLKVLKPDAILTKPIEVDELFQACSA